MFSVAILGTSFCFLSGTQTFLTYSLANRDLDKDKQSQRNLKSATNSGAELDDASQDSRSSSQLASLQNGGSMSPQNAIKDSTHSLSPVATAATSVIIPEAIDNTLPYENEDNNEGCVDPELGYVPLLENEYKYARRDSQKDLRRMQCDCTLTKDEMTRGIRGCVDDCLNRMLLVECGQRCRLGDNCGNKRFQRREYARVERFITDKKGFGLRTVEPLAAGCFVMEYVGEVLSNNEFRRRVKRYDAAQHFYFMELKPGLAIDATVKGNLSRHMNHSCDPNCTTEKWTVNGDLRVGFFTKKPVRAGEELTFDYKLEVYGREAQKCYCGAENCRGAIGTSKLSTGSSTGSTQIAARVARRDERRSRLNEAIDEQELSHLEQGGLRSRDDVLNLCRIMVRADDTDMRCRLLDIVASTAEACLRLFVDYHGLELLWSWFTDLDGYEIREKMIATLQKLPVTNKTTIKESKLLTASHQLASDLSDEIEAMRSEAPPASTQVGSDGGDVSSLGSPSEGKIKPIKELYNSLSLLLDRWDALKEFHRIPKLEQQRRKDDEREVDRREKDLLKKARREERKRRAAIAASAVVAFDEDSKETAVDCATPVAPAAGVESLSTISNNRAKGGRSSGNSVRSKRVRSSDSRSRSRSPSSLNSGNTITTGSGMNTSSRDRIGSSRRRSRSRSRSRERSSRHRSRHHHRRSSKRSASRSSSSSSSRGGTNSSNNRHARNLGGHTTEATEAYQHGGAPIHFISKEERRRRFALQAQRDDELRMQQQQQQTMVITHGSVPMHSPMDPTAVTLTPMFRDENGRFVPVPPELLPQLPPPMMMQLGPPSQLPPPPPPNIMAAAAAAAAVAGAPPLASTIGTSGTSAVHHIATTPIVGVNGSGAPSSSNCLPPLGPSLLTGHLGTSRMTRAAPPSAPPPMIAVASGPSGHVVVAPPVPPLNLPPPPFTSIPPPPLPHPSPGTPAVRVPSFASVAASSGTSSLPDQTAPALPPVGAQNDRVVARTRTVRLPDFWKATKAETGFVYFYNSITREVSWDVPESAKAVASVADFATQLRVLASSTSTGGPVAASVETKSREKRSTEQQSKVAVDDITALQILTTSGPGAVIGVSGSLHLGTEVTTDLSTELAVAGEAKALKDRFMAEISQYIVGILTPYRREDCQRARITNDEDFRKLARKMTHAVFIKELRHCKKIESLSVNDVVRSKTRDFVMKYMTKFGDIFVYNSKGKE